MTRRRTETTNCMYRRATTCLTYLTLLVLLGCAAVPLTGRSQLSLIRSSDLATMGAEAYPQMLAEEKILTRGPAVDQVRRVGERIRRAAEEGDFKWASRGTFDWEFKVIDNDEVVNAWALPGGKVAVYTGILAVAQTDAGLATVMGHELAHAIAEHGGERMSQQAVAELGRQGAAAVLGTQSEAAVSIFNQVYAVGQGAVMLPFSRKHECEADRIGLLLMAAAGYDPREAVGFWTRMSEIGGEQPPELLSTHPSHETRITEIQGWMPEALEIFEGRRKL